MATFLFFFLRFMFYLPLTTVILTQHASPGKPLIYVKDTDYADTIEVQTTGEYVYVLYESIGLVKVYDQQGEYVASIAFCRGGFGGHDDLLVRDRRLYIDTKGWYVFEGIELVDYIVYDNTSSIRQLTDELRTSTSDQPYFERYGNVYRYEENGEEKLFLRRHWWYRFTTMPYSWVIFVLFFLPLLIRQYVRQLRKKDALMGRKPGKKSWPDN